MTSVSFNGQSFSIDGRRVWILAASMQYVRIPPELWADRITAAREAGFNTIETACPWMVHEPRRGRYDFQNGADVSRFVELCGQLGMRVILRPGPYVGGDFDGGGLPAWLGEDPQVLLRQASEPFLDRVGRYVRKLFSELSSQLAARGGPILLVQVEHDWTCANDAEGEKYLGEVARLIREAGVAVPLINRNNLWLEPVGTIDTWRGDDDLLVNARQLRTVQPEAPRLVAAFESVSRQAWGQQTEHGLRGPVMLRRLAEILAASAQPIVTPFHAGTNFGFLGGRRPGPDGGPTMTSAGAGAPLGEAGFRGATYHQIRRLLVFAEQFAPLFAELDPDYQPVAVDPSEVLVGEKSGRKGGARLSVVPLRGAGGRVVFMFSEGSSGTTTLLLDSGIRLPVHLGDQPVSWCVLDVDLRGRAKLDYTNLCPFAIIDRSVVVLHGPARTEALLSVNGTPLQTTVPSGSKPTILEHKGVTFLICNRDQIDTTFFDEQRVFVGAAGFDADGEPRAAEGVRKGWTVDEDRALTAYTFPSDAARGAAKKRSSIGLKDWEAAPADAHATGKSPRYASLAGPQSLAASGAMIGYGWYRLKLKVASARKRLVHLPEAGDRVHLFVDGALKAILGEGPGSESGPIELALPKGGTTMTALVDNLGRFADGNDLDRTAGIHGHLYEVKPMKTTRPKTVSAPPADPFTVRAFIKGGVAGRGSDEQQLAWTFTHAKKSPILFEITDCDATGTIVLNDQEIAWYAGATGGRRLRLVLDPATLDAFKRGKNVLRFAPDIGQPNALKEVARTSGLSMCVENLSASATWGFAKWEPPAATAFKAVAGPTAMTKLRGTPCWWRCRFTVDELPRPLWFQATGLSKGQLFVNGRNLGRYFTATRTGKAIGPQQKLYVPEPWIHLDRPNEVMIFDEHGFAPVKTKLVLSDTGDLDD
jgi:hypothetical protein